MAVNLVDAVSAVLTPEAVGALARALGLDEAVAQRLVRAAIPTILAAFATLAAAPSGARRVSEAVSSADPDILSRIAAADADAMTRGAGLVGQLLGGSGLSGVVGALSQYAGAAQPAAQSIVGAVAQAAIGAIGQQDPSNWSDGRAIAAFLNGQKGDVAAAIPPEIERALAPTGIVAGLGAIGAERPPKPLSPAAAAAASAAAARAGAAPPAPSSRGIPIWAAIVLLVIIALAAIWWFVAESLRPAPVPPPVKQGLLSGPCEFASVALPEFRC